MGSVPSTPNRESTDDPWWPIENQNLTLNPNQIEAVMDDSVEHTHDIHYNDQSQLNITLQNDETESNSEIVINVSSVDVNVNLLKDTNSSDSDDASASHSCVSGDVDKSMDTVKTKSNQSLEEFKEELRIKREKSRSAIAELRNEITGLRKQLAEEKTLNKRLIDEKNGVNATDLLLDDAITTDLSKDVALRSHLADAQLSLQNANAEILSLTRELTGTRKQVSSLKEVIAVSKEMVEIRESQLCQLKTKLKEIENSLAEREVQLMSENLRQEYDRQLVNIRNLRALYEERARVSAAERENLNRQLETSRAELQSEVVKNKNLEEHIASLDTDLKSTSTDLYSTREQLAYCKAENKGLHDEMAVINQLFSQLLVGFNGCNDIDIDKLTHMLEENRELLNDMTSRECSQEGAAQLPKLLFDLVSQAGQNAATTIELTNDPNVPSTSNDSDEILKASKVTSAQEIMHNLPKVWKVLIELLNHQKMEPVQFKENSESEDCYKSVQTPTGPQMVLSVSKTYIKLKDLILEKKFLQKETNKLKNLNSHLEVRLEQQEKRLGTVSVELNKTWSLVGRMQRQHRQLHTHEQVLRYQLQQKRRMLSELKDELEYCRRKWALAKEKNNESQSQWDSLRQEFIKRKEQDACNSAESGYSDGPISEDDDENINVTSYEMKRKANKEKFLLKVDQTSRKLLRIHSVSPIRCAKALHISRRNSDSHVTQFATEVEVFQTTPIIVQPIIHSIVSSNSDGGNIVKNVFHFEHDRPGPSNNIALVKVTEASVHNSKVTPPISNARKLIESKANGTKLKMCCELRKKSAQMVCKPEESLEHMFMRLTNQETDENAATETSTCSNLNEATILSDDEERRSLRAARTQRLEEQCKNLITQVTKTSNCGDELNQHTDVVQKRYSPVRDTPLQISTEEISNDKTELNDEPVASTSQNTTNVIPMKTDEECLSTIEQEYTSRRDARLQRLETECKAYFNKVVNRNDRVTDIDNKLEYLHGRYGSEAFETETNAEGSSTSSTSTSNVANKTDDQCLSTKEQEYTSRRDERLKRLETECKAFLSKVTITNDRADVIDNQVDNLQAQQSTSKSTIEYDDLSQNQIVNEMVQTTSEINKIQDEEPILQSDGDVAADATADAAADAAADATADAAAGADNTNA